MNLFLMDTALLLMNNATSIQLKISITITLKESITITGSYEQETLLTSHKRTASDYCYPS